MGEDCVIAHKHGSSPTAAFQSPLNCRSQHQPLRLAQLQIIEHVCEMGSFVRKEQPPCMVY